MARRKDGRTRSAHIRDFLAVSPAAAKCLEEQRRTEGLLARVRDLLAPAARPHCIQAQAAQGLLTVTVDSTAWATRLRYQAPDLALRLADTGIGQVKVQARPRAALTGGDRALHLEKLTPAVIDHLLAAADCTADAGLAELFRRLANRHRSQGRGPDGPDL